MHYAVSTYTVFEKSIHEALKLLIKDGWKHIELMGEGEHHGRELLEMDRDQLKELADQKKMHHLTLGYHLPIEGFNLATQDEATLAVWKKCKEVIERLCVRYILFHPGSHRSVDKGIQNIIKMTKRMLEELPEDVDIVIENVPQAEQQIGSNMGELLQIVEGVANPRLKIMLDTGHAYMNSKEQFIEESKKVFPYLFGLHVNDNHGMEDEHLQIGEGTIPFDMLIPELPLEDLTIVMETNTLERAEVSKKRFEQIVTSKTEVNE